MDASSESRISRAVSDALRLGSTVFDKLPGDLRTQAIARYNVKVAERDRDMGTHGQHSDPAVRAALGED